MVVQQAHRDRDVRPAVVDRIPELVGGHTGSRRADGQDRSRGLLRSGVRGGFPDRVRARAAMMPPAPTTRAGRVGRRGAQRAGDLVQVLLLDGIDDERGEAGRVAVVPLVEEGADS